MGKIRIREYDLRDLKEKFEKREFAIPEVQRQYVWNKARICNLMDSIFHNYPIGMSLIWVAPYSKALDIRPNNKTIIPPFNPKAAKKTELIIDGQQRLSSLYGVLFGLEPRPDANSDINFKELFFDCDKGAVRRFIINKRLTDDTVGYIRLYDLLNTRPSVLKSRLKLTKWEAKQAYLCYKAFHSYKFFILEFEGLNEQKVEDIFIRINSAGMTVSRADTIFSKLKNVKLRDLMINTKRGLRHGFDSISVDALQNTLGLAYGATQVGQKGINAVLKKIDKNKKGNKEFSRAWKRLQFGYQEAVDFLVNNLYVGKLEFLPSQNIYSILAYFFFLNQSRAKPNQTREIKKWFWHTACGDRYSGAAFNRNVPDDIKFFRRLAAGNNARYSIDERINPTDFLKTSYKGSRGSSSTNAYFVMLRKNRPKYLMSGDEIILDDPTAISNRKDRHHIYPYALLKRNNVKKQWINSIGNICYLESDENQSFGDNHPRKYLIEYKRYKHFSKVMKSHLIPHRPDSPIWERNVRKGYLSFLNQRGKMLVAAIERLAGSKIFDKFDRIRRI
jgi:hypothetical protein